MGCKLLRCLQEWPPFEVVGTSKQVPWRPDNGPLDQVGILQCRGMSAQRQVEALADNVDEPVRGDFHDADLGMAAQERRQDLAQRKLRKLDRYRHANDPAGFREPLAHRLFRDVGALQQGDSVLVELSAYVGQGKLARGPVDQANAQRSLQLLDPVT